MTEPNLPPPSAYFLANLGGTLVGGLIAAFTAWLLLHSCECKDNPDAAYDKTSATVVIEAPTKS